MQKIIISDTSCIIVLDKIGELDLLHSLFGEITVTSIIAQEFGKGLPPWMKIEDPSNKHYQEILYLTVDSGEASAIALGMEKSDCLLILDDLKARKLAKELGLRYTGTAGILLDAKELGFINSVTEVLQKVRKTNFRLTPELESKIIKKAGEESE